MTTSLPSTPFIAKAANPDKPSFHRDYNDFTQPVVADTLVVFDSRLQDLEILYKALLPNTIGCTLTTQDHALEAIARLLQQTGAKQLAIMAHGEPGVVHLGAKAIDLAALEESAGLLRAWGVESIDLYACEVGANQEFVAKFSELTGARVAAAAHSVGSESLGGSWELADSGPVPFALERLASYGGILAILTESVNGNASDGYINLSEVGTSFTVTGTANNVGTTGTTAQGNQVLFAIYSDSTLLYWKVTNIVGGFYSSGSINLNTIIGANNLNTFQGSLQLKVYQGAGGTNNSSGSYSTADTSPTPPTFNFNRSGSATLAAGTTAGLYASVPSIILDTIAPSSSAPGIPDLISDTGFSSTDNITNVALPTFTVGLTGTGAVAGDRIQLFRNTNLYASQVLSQADIDATVVTVIATNPINTGTISARIADAAGNVSTSASVTPFTVTIDTIAPVKTVTAIDVVGAQTITATLSAALAAAVASVSAEQLWASTDNGTTWTNITSFVSDTNVSWATTLSGSSTILMEVRDTAGNIGPATSKTYAIDTTPPASPTFNLANDSGSSSSDGITNVGIVNVSDIEANATWQYSTNGGSTWSAAQPAAITSFTLAAGTYAAGAIKVRQTDLSGNTTNTPSQNPTAITIDTTAPSPIVLSSTTIAENATNEQDIATLSTLETVSYSLVSGFGSTDNGLFQIVDDKLKIIAPNLTPIKSSYQIRLQAVDTAGNVTVTPTTINLSDTVYADISYALVLANHLYLTGAGDFSGTGNNNGNIIVGNSGNNYIDGGAGNDDLYGGNGNDSLIGGIGDDIYHLSSLPSDTSNDIIVEAAGEGADTAYSVLTVDALAAYVENLILLGTDDINATGNNGYNFITGNSGNNLLNGLGSNDYIIGGAGNDTINGGDGDEYYIDGGAGNDSIEGGTGNDSIEGGTGNDLIVGGDGNDILRDYSLNGGDDTLIGGAGNDDIYGGNGNDSLVGGMGNDIYYLSYLPSDTINDFIVEVAGEGVDTACSVLTVNTLNANVENLILLGTDDINATGNNGYNFISGNSGNNVLNGLGSNDYVIGGAGNDTIDGGDGDEYYIDGGTGNDSIDGGTGNDSIEGGTGNDLIVGGDGNDILRDYDFNGGDDTLIGGAGNDDIYGGNGTDSLLGSTGDDIYYLSYLPSDTSNDIVVEVAGEGTDTAYAVLTINVLDANVENLVLLDSSDINGIGNGENNAITGNSGNNILNGGAGNDTLRGGAGSDQFEFSLTAPIPRGSSITSLLGVDTVADFAVAADKIVLKGITTISPTFFASVTTDANALGYTGDAKVVYSTGSGRLFYNADSTTAGLGSQGGNFAILSNQPMTLSDSDFTII